MQSIVVSRKLLSEIWQNASGIGIDFYQTSGNIRYYRKFEDFVAGAEKLAEDEGIILTDQGDFFVSSGAVYEMSPQLRKHFKEEN